jgi:hypothetical protein
MMLREIMLTQCADRVLHVLAAGSTDSAMGLLTIIVLSSADIIYMINACIRSVVYPLCFDVTILSLDCEYAKPK